MSESKRPMTVVTRVTDTLLDIKDEQYKTKFKIMIRVILARTIDGEPRVDGASMANGSIFGPDFNSCLVNRNIDFDMRIVFDDSSFNDGTHIEIGDLDAISRFLTQAEEILNKDINIVSGVKRVMFVSDIISILNSPETAGEDKIALQQLFKLEFSEDSMVIANSPREMMMAFRPEECEQSSICGPLLDLSNFATLNSRICMKTYSKCINPYKPAQGTATRSLPTLLLLPWQTGSISDNDYNKIKFRSLQDGGTSLNIFEWRDVKSFCDRFDPYTYAMNVKNTFIYDRKSIQFAWMMLHPFEIEYTSEQRQMEKQKNRPQTTEDVERELINKGTNKNTPPQQQQQINNIFNQLK